MIDRPKRDKLAEALRHLLSGRMDNLAFDDLEMPGEITDSEDQALFAVFYSVWPHYDDFRSHPLRLTEGQRLDFKRCVIFLLSDAEYEWQLKSPGIIDFFRRVADEVTGHRFGWRQVQPIGDMAVWPFFRREDYQRALDTPRLLRGNV